MTLRVVVTDIQRVTWTAFALLAMFIYLYSNSLIHKHPICQNIDQLAITERLGGDGGSGHRLVSAYHSFPAMRMLYYIREPITQRLAVDKNQPLDFKSDLKSKNN